MNNLTDIALINKCLQYTEQPQSEMLKDFHAEYLKDSSIKTDEIGRYKNAAIFRRDESNRKQISMLAILIILFFVGNSIGSIIELNEFTTYEVILKSIACMMMLGMITMAYQEARISLSLSKIVFICYSLEHFKSGGSLEGLELISSKLGIRMNFNKLRYSLNISACLLVLLSLSIFLQ